jgi:proteasome component ECM29
LVAHLFLSGSKVASDISLELLVLGSSIEKPLQRELGRIRDLSLHANSDVQAQICRMRAILSLRLTDAEAQVDIKNALQLLQEPSQTFGRRYGSLLYLPYFILRLSLAGRSIISMEDVNIVYERLLNHLDDRDGRIAEAALDGLAQLALLDLPIAFDSTKIQRLVTKTTNLRIREAAIITLGYISLSYTSTDDKLKSTIAFLLTQQDSNAVDTYIATGEALAVAFGGFQASVVPIKLNLHPLADLPAVERDDLFAKTVDQILTLHVRTPKKTCRKAACLWLLTLVQLLKHNPVMTSRLKQLHQAFMTLMADQDEFVIESASQGVQLVYKLSDQKTKDELVSSLMGTFASDRAAKAAAGNIGISSESELFAPGTMSVGENNSVSTYKDICDLAVDMGNNELGQFFN